MFLAGKPRNSKQPKGMCALKISPHSFIAVTLVDNSVIYNIQWKKNIAKRA